MEEPISSPKEDLQLHTVAAIKHHGLGYVTSKYCLGVSRHQKYSNVVQLRYDQIKSPMANKIVQECRGLILDIDEKNKKVEVVCFPYRKFFNYKEPQAAKLDWTQGVKVYEKLDGSIATLYWYRDECQQLFWDIWKQLNYSLPKEKGMCYMFEMITPRNVIIVRPKKEQLILHGARNLTTLQELEPEPIAAENHWECVKTYSFGNIDEVLGACKSLNPVENEGFVVRDVHWNRLKVKSPAYVALAHLSEKDKQGMNAKHMLQIVRSNEGDEFLAYFPKYKALYHVTKAKYDRLRSTLEAVWEKVKDIKDPSQLEEQLQSLCTANIKGLIMEMNARRCESATSFLVDYDIKALRLLVEQMEVPVHKIPVDKHKLKPLSEPRINELSMDSKDSANKTAPKKKAPKDKKKNKNKLEDSFIPRIPPANAPSMEKDTMEKKEIETDEDNTPVPNLVKKGNKNKNKKKKKKNRGVDTTPFEIDDTTLL